MSRRRWFRFRSFGHTLVRWVDGTEEVVLIANVSLGGLAIVSQLARPVGERVVIEVAAPPGVIPLEGEIVHASGGPLATMGVRVIHADSRAIAGLRRLRDSIAWLAPAPYMTLGDLAILGHPDVVAFAMDFPSAFLVATGQRAEPVATATVHAIRSPGDMTSWHSVSVGRDRTSDIRIDHQRVSRHHAVLERSLDRGTYLVWDRGSHNGTRVSGVRLHQGKPHALADNDVLSLGGCELVFLSAEALFPLLSQVAVPAAVARRSPC